MAGRVECGMDSYFARRPSWQIDHCCSDAGFVGELVHVEQFGGGLMRKEQRVASVGSSGGRCSGGEAQRRKGQLPGRK